MWRSKKFIVIASLVVVLIAGSIGAGVALAQTGNGDNSQPKILMTDNVTPSNTLMARVAEKLGIDQKTLEDAFTQARNEMQVEARDQYLANLVKEGKITQDQADKYKAWLDSKPDIPLQFGPGTPGPGMHRGFGKFGGGFRGWCAPPPPAETE